MDLHSSVGCFQVFLTQFIEKTVFFLMFFDTFIKIQWLKQCKFISGSSLFLFFSFLYSISLYFILCYDPNTYFCCYGSIVYFETRYFDVPRFSFFLGSFKKQTNNISLKFQLLLIYRKAITSTCWFYFMLKSKYIYQV